MTRSTEKGGAGVTVLVIVIILIIAGALFFMNRGDSSDVMVDDGSAAPSEEVQGASADVDASAGVMMEDGATDAAADATMDGEAAAQ